ncbi:MAG: threonylcarbamoyl-AMP synthase [Deltaproteobacteria bacterium]|nr:threonylcarbamoyl-AMP synthase [Deltaproteobacteria bacterium]
MRLRTHMDRPAPRKLAPAVDALRRGEVVICPTDTGYAFVCALSSSKGIAKLRRLKGIEEDSRKPLAMMVNELAELGKYGIMDNQVFRMVRRILPGPYTVVLRATGSVPRVMRNRDHEIGVRMPENAACRMLVELVGEPLLVGSVTGAEEEPELEDPELFEKRYRADVKVVVDAGPLWPDPSTVLRATDGEIEVLREGQGAIPG